MPRLLAVAFAVAAALALVAVPVQAQQEADVSPARVMGETRFETAARIATLTFEQADAAIVVTGQDFPDALAGSFAAGSAVAPILLVARDQVPRATFDALEALGVQDVVLLGGTDAITRGVEVAFDESGYGTVRIAGASRYETAAEVAQTYGDLVEVGTLEGQRTAFLASGERLPDALSVGPLAASANMPLLLTPRGQPSTAVDRTLEELGIERVVVVGGTAAVGSDVVEHYQGLGYEVERFSGATRTETAAVVAQNAIERFEGFSAALLLLGRGDDYPDALAASIHAAVNGAPILLTANPTVLSPSTAGYLSDLCPDIEAVRALGGPGAVSEQALSEAVAVAGRCGGEGPGDGSCSAEELDADIAAQAGLPEAVAQTRANVAEAAVACDYGRLVELTGDEFTYSFGAEGDPAGHWRALEDAGQEPLAYLRALLDRPYGTIVTSESTRYVWPSAFAYESWAEVPAQDREALRPLYGDEDFAFFEEFGGYIGYRVGIDAGGDWLFFVGGD